jgi:antirestriction protein ArdC
LVFVWYICPQWPAKCRPIRKGAEMSKSKSNDVYSIITEKIIEHLESGTVPWAKPWAGGESPRNLASGKEYRGINPFLLSSLGYASPHWLTFKQAKERGGNVKKGEKGTIVVFWKLNKYDDDLTGETKKVPILRYYRVFNAEQCEGINAPELTTRPDFQPIEEAERIIEAMQNKPVVQFKEPKAYYQPSEDLVNMPRKELFNGPEEMYSTMFHELAHSTGHKKRLDRKAFNKAAFGSETYSKEELVAELASAFVCNVSGIEKTIQNQAAYISGWLKVLKGDKKMIVLAAAQAQKAADFILNRQEVNESI